MLQKLSLRPKLALIALGPLLALLVLLLLGLRSDTGDSSTTSDTQSHATASALTGQLFEAFRAESVDNQNAVALSGFDLGPSRTFTDDAVTRWLEGLDGTSFASLDDGTLAAELTNIDTGYRGRTDAAVAAGDAAAAFSNDVEALEMIERFDGLVANSAPASASGIDRAADLTTLQSTNAQLQVLGLWASHQDTIPAELPGALAAADQAGRSYELRNATELATSPSYESILVDLRGLGAGDPVSLSAEEWRAASDLQSNTLREARNDVVGATSQAAAQAGGSSQGNLRTNILGLLIGTLLAIGALIFVSKSLGGSLKALRNEAARVAESDLPELANSLRTGTPVSEELGAERHIEGIGSDEFGDVAQSLHSIRQSASGLGVQVGELQNGIADTFVNLARRNQSLLDRQLEAIDTLEAEERDSDRLAVMYRVDHLATRMRRNAESLLVLADAKTPDRHGPAVELREVLRVAIGEVEDYRRIVPVALEDLSIPGHRAQDLAHLLAELMENATQQSPPGTAVDVSGGFEPASGDYIISVLDHGTGIAPDRLPELNALLEKPPVSTMTISHSIGLQVVSRLSHSLGLDVRLAAGPQGGTLAAVRVPAETATQWGGKAPSPAANPQVAPLATMTRTPTPEPTPLIPSGEQAISGLPVVGAAASGLDAAMPEAPAMPDMAMPETPAVADFGAPAVPETPAMPDMAMPETPAVADFGAPAIPDMAMPETPAVPDFGAPAIPDMAMPETPAVPDFGAPAIPDMAMPETPAVPDFGAPAMLETPAMPDMAMPETPAVPDFGAPAIPDMAMPETPAVPDFGAPAVPETPAMPETPAVADFGAPAIPDMAMPETPAVADFGAPAIPDMAMPETPAANPFADTPMPETPAIPDMAAPAAPAMPETPAAPAAAMPTPPAAAPVTPPSFPAAAPIPDAPAPTFPSVTAEPTPAVPVVQPVQGQPMAPAPAAAAPAPAPAPAVAPASVPTQPEPEITSSGLTRRKRSAPADEPLDLEGDRAAPSQRSPDQVRNMLSRYKTGLERGRGGSNETDGES